MVPGELRLSGRTPGPASARDQTVHRGETDVQHVPDAAARVAEQALLQPSRSPSSCPRIAGILWSSLCLVAQHPAAFVLLRQRQGIRQGRQGTRTP